MHNNFLGYVHELIEKIDTCQRENIDKASDLIVDCLKRKGVVQAFGSGHSYGSALELVERAGGLFATKMIKDPALGIYEKVEGIGSILMNKVQIMPEDVVVIISYSGRNPLGIEVAEIVKKKGARIIAVTSLESSKKATSRHSGGKLLYEYADVVLDMMGVEGDAAMQLDPLPTKICPTSSIAAAALIQGTVYETVQKLIKDGIVPDVRISANLDHGTENNIKVAEKYADRIFRI